MNIGNKPGIPQDKVLLDNLGKIAYTLDKAYISNLAKEYMPIPYSTGDGAYNKSVSVDYISNIRALQVNRWVFNKDEKPGECFKNILSLFADGEHTLAMVVVRKPSQSEIYFVIKNEGEARNEDSKTNILLLSDSLTGNFPGTDVKVLGTPQDIENTESMFCFSFAESVSVLSNTPSEFSEDYITQGIDKLLNGIVPKTDEETYAVIFLAESLSHSNIRNIIDGYEDMATAIHPFADYQFQVGKNETATQGEMESSTDTQGISNSVSKTHSINAGFSAGSHAGVSGGLNLGPLNIGANVGKSLGISGGYGYSWGQTKTVSNSTSQTQGKSSSISLGKNESTNYSYKSYMVSNLIDKISKTVDRLEASKSTGLWKYATYVLANDSKQSKNIANYIRALSQGKESYIEPAIIQEWSKKEKLDENGGNEFDEIIQYLSHFTHPVFVTADENNYNAMAVTPTSYVSTDEVSQMIAFPRNSVAGLPIIQCACFGREPHSVSKLNCDVAIGNAYHMLKEDNHKAIKISKENLTAHTFVTGSTGSGKSNTVYSLITQLCPEDSKDIHFLVVEPAKGEYKVVFGGRKDVCVYGTNPKLTTLLRINPFSFPEEIHVYEHMDRLVEIFNVCWPMYAAMPAVLKDAVEKAYIDAGWDLASSENKYDNRLFPTFVDVLRNIDIVMNESQYSADSKGDYKGALCTRIKSLTNGINGMIFSANEITSEELFDRNVIIDLSRVGSTETKSLIMGLLVLKLQEYRIASSGINETLKHITVLEEAHNLLKRTSTEQSGESSNLLGKSVEMLTNAIAEMRTYGEGFIIADQAPGLLDMAVIRNTNTKIVLRLPDYSDRELVGKAMGLNEHQIDELAKLDKGVAAVYQNDWIESVLCKVMYYKYDKCKTFGVKTYEDSTKDIQTTLSDVIIHNRLFEKVEWNDDQLLTSNLSALLKCSIIDYRGKHPRDEEALAKIAYNLFDGEMLLKEAPSAPKDKLAYFKRYFERYTPYLRQLEIEIMVKRLHDEYNRRHPEQQPPLDLIGGRNSQK